MLCFVLSTTSPICDSVLLPLRISKHIYTLPFCYHSHRLYQACKKLKMVMMRNVVISFLVVASLHMPVAYAKTHYIGDALGWDIGVDYETWASANLFNVGDNLAFVYLAVYHNVLHVREEDYNSCTTTSPLDSHGSGMSVTEILSEGKFFFICGTPGYCELGMKVAITTTGYTGSEDSPPPPASKSRSPPPSKTRPPPLANPWLPKGSNSAQRYSTAGSFVVTFALMLLATF